MIPHRGPAVLPASEILLAKPTAERSACQGIRCEKVIERIIHRYGNLTAADRPHMPHRWRHTYGAQLLRSGENIYIVRTLFGYTDLRTRVIYLHLTVDDLAVGVDKAFG